MHQTYHNYQTSNTEWLGDIPAHWEVRKVKYIFDHIKTGTTPTTAIDAFFNGNIQWYTPKDLNNEILTNSERTVSELALSSKEIGLFNADSILVVAIGATAGKSSYMPVAGTFNQQITGFYTKNYDNRYYYFLFKILSSFLLRVANYTTLPILNNDFFKNLLFPLPPLIEQQAIANFLDEQTAKIDHAISQQEQMIGLLKSYKQSLIQTVVTQGLKPNTALRPSGIEWLGDIPAHWEVRKLKYLGIVYAGMNGKKGDDFSKEYQKSMKCFIPFVDVCNNTKIAESQCQYVKISKDENQNKVKKYDILFLMSSETIEDIAKNCIYLGNEEELYLNSFCNGFRITEVTVVLEFINYLLLSKAYRFYFSLSGRGFTRMNIKREYISNTPVLLPPLSEQRAMADFLDTKVEKIDKAIALSQLQITQLSTYRLSLIDSAVCGKIKIV